MQHGAAKKPRSGTNLKIIHAPLLESVPQLVHGFSTRSGGHSQEYGENQLNLGFTVSDKREAVERNRTEFLSALGAQELRLLTLKQIHSDIIHVVTSPEQLPAKGKSLKTECSCRRACRLAGYRKANRTEDSRYHAGPLRFQTSGFTRSHWSRNSSVLLCSG